MNRNTPEADKALVYNLRFKFGDVLKPYSDAEIVKAYDDWFLCSVPDPSADNEADFIAYLPIKDAPR